MAKTVTLRLSDEEYQAILASAQTEHRPISNFITHAVLAKINESLFVDPVEMNEIKSDKELMKRLKSGSSQAKKMKGKFVE